MALKMAADTATTTSHPKKEPRQAVSSPAKAGSKAKTKSRPANSWINRVEKVRQINEAKEALNDNHDGEVALFI